MSKIKMLLQRGIEFSKKGRDSDARSLFRAIIHEEPKNQLAWGWYVHSFQDENERIQAFDAYLKVFPKDVNALRLQVSLLTKQNSTREKKTQEAEAFLKTNNRKLEVTKRNLSRTRFISIIASLFLLGSLLISRGVGAYKNNRLSRQLSSLNTEYEVLQSKHNTLTRDYSELKSTYWELSNQYNILLGDYNVVMNEYNILAGEYAWLESNSVQPPYILTSGRNVHLVFIKNDGTFLEWTISSDWLEYHLRRGDELRSNLAFDINLYNTITGETYWTVDDRDFIDPAPFTNLIADLYYQSESDDLFIKEVWNIVAQLTTYTSELQETPRFPMETLLSGGGDCEDHAILFASMILAAPTDWDVRLVYMDSDHPTQPQTINHVITQVITADQSYLVEATSKDYMSPYEQGVNGWYFDVYK